ncbi:hypothetical protein KBB89_00410 [Candidatus Gracilibacteria bacterium]|nr:hypothetical protein [Candidatus Gracilibacteria bacterium]
MKFEYISKNKIFILGAGASVDYGLPTWIQLNPLIEGFLGELKNLQYPHREEILEWIKLIGEKEKYQTLDDCIFHETSSVKYKENGQDIELAIFGILKILFTRLYKKNNSWIKNLNEKIRRREGLDWSDIFFINYNYDNVLSDNILDFSYLPKTDRERLYRERIEELSEVEIPCLYPHGLFEYSDRGFLLEQSDTINSHNETILESVSCHHSRVHEIIFSVSLDEVNLYILGLGGGLEINLNNIFFSDVKRIKNIYITIRKDPGIPEKEHENKKKSIISFLTKKFDIEKENILIHNDCTELIEKCFSS